jgi:hypothetical protein
MAEEDLSSVFCLPNGEQLYLHSDAPCAGDWPVTLSQVFLLQDAQILMSNGKHFMSLLYSVLIVQVGKTVSFVYFYKQDLLSPNL